MPARLFRLCQAAPRFFMMRVWRPIGLALRRRRTLARLGRTKQPIVLFLAPEAGLAPFFASHAILARSVNEAGHASLVLSCDGLLPICPVKYAMGMKPTPPGDRDNAACQFCRSAALRSHEEYGLVGVSLESLLGGSEREKIAKILAENADDLSKTVVDGIKFGTVAAGETLRARRRSDVSEFTAEDRDLVKAMLFTSLAVYLALDIVSSRYAVKRIAYFGDYVYWITADILAQKRGIAVTRVNHLYNRDVDRRFIGLHPGSGNTHLLDQLEHWDEHRDSPITPAAIASIVEGSLYRLQGHGGASTHSPNWVRRGKGLQEELGLSPDRKTIVAYSSSADEFIASQAILEAMDRPYAQGPKPFRDQATWLRALIAWVGARPSLQLIVRLHPRMGSGNHRSSFASEYFRLKDDLAECPLNVAIVWPDDPVSSYNLAEIADAAVVAWSTMGLELARFGVPVVAAFSGIGSFPTGRFIAFEETSQRYFQAVETALNSPASADNITEAFRWTYHAFWSPTVDVSDVIPTHDYDGIPPWRRPRNLDTIVRVLVGGKDMSALNMAGFPRGAAAEASERKAVLEATERFAHFFMSGENRPDARPQGLRPQGDGSVILDADDQVIQRYSPLVHRLARMLEQSTAEACAGLRARSAV
jgi:hypothetical protein